jgi:hypothetical protein
MTNFPNDDDEQGGLLQLGLRWGCGLLPGWLALAVASVTLAILDALIPPGPPTPPPVDVEADLGRSLQSDEA